MTLIRFSELIIGIILGFSYAVFSGVIYGKIFEGIISTESFTLLMFASAGILSFIILYLREYFIRKNPFRDLSTGRFIIYSVGLIVTSILLGLIVPIMLFYIFKPNYVDYSGLGGLIYLFAPFIYLILLSLTLLYFKFPKKVGLTILLIPVVIIFLLPILSSLTILFLTSRY